MTEIDTTPQPTAPDRDGVPRYEPTVIEPHWQQRWADTQPVPDRPVRHLAAASSTC